MTPIRNSIISRATPTTISRRYGHPPGLGWSAQRLIGRGDLVMTQLGPVFREFTPHIRFRSGRGRFTSMMSWRETSAR